MLGQQHTIPVTGDGTEDNSKNAPWSCTQPQSKSRSGGFLQRLSQSTCSFKAVTKPAATIDEEPSHDVIKLKSWGSDEDLLKEPMQLCRSPSLPCLDSKSLTGSKLLRGAHFPSKATPIKNKKFDSTPQKHRNTVYTPSQKQAMFSKLLKTPQQNPLTTDRVLSNISLQSLQATPQHLTQELLNQKNLGMLDKENCLPQKPTPANEKQPPVSLWHQKILEEMIQVSPKQVVQQTNFNSERSDASRNLFESTPLKHDFQLNQNQCMKKQESYNHNMQQNNLLQPQMTNFSRPHEVVTQPPHQPHENPLNFHQTGKSQQYSPDNQFGVQVSSMLRQNFNNQYHTNSKPQHYQDENLPQIPLQQSVNQLNEVKPQQYSTQNSVEQNMLAESKTRFKQPAPKATDSTHGLVCVNQKAYAIGQCLGRGGSSEVYQVVRQSDQKVFAIKCVNLRCADEFIRNGYLNEINLLQRMQGNARVVQIIDYELCETKQVLFVVMEKGVRDLSSFLKDRSKKRDMRIGTVEAFWTDMVEAVAAIHDNGIIHSDLKPANFLLVGEVGFHQLKLIDFGIASSIQSDMTSVVRDSPAGTLNYMSPEAVRGMQGQRYPVKINYKSDIWALGCILYNILYGCTPFQQITHVSLKAEAICNPRHVIEFPTHSSFICGDGAIPAPLLHTVQACLNRDPAARPTAKQLLETRYCGCNDGFDLFMQGLANLIRNHPMGKELSCRFVAALQCNDDKQQG